MPSNLIFPTFLQRAAVPAAVVAMLVDVSDRLLEQELRGWDYSRYLAGRMHRGAQVRIPPLRDYDPHRLERQVLFRFFAEAGGAYMSECSGRGGAPRALELDDAWTVRQLAGDDNPPHGHDGMVSGVLYLRVPPQIDHASRPDGHLRFLPTDPLAPTPSAEPTAEDRMRFVCGMPRSAGAPAEIAGRLVQPVLGEMFLFPSWLVHEVRAFAGPGERRSVAFNLRVAAPQEREAPRSAASRPRAGEGGARHHLLCLETGSLVELWHGLELDATCGEPLLSEATTPGPRLQVEIHGDAVRLAPTGGPRGDTPPADGQCLLSTSDELRIGARRFGYFRTDMEVLFDG